MGNRVFEEHAFDQKNSSALHDMESISKMIPNVFFLLVEESHSDDFPWKVFFALFKAKLKMRF